MMTQDSQALYRDNLASILEHTGGRHLLQLHEVKTYTGLTNSKTVHARFPYFHDGYISAETLARCLSRREK